MWERREVPEFGRAEAVVRIMKMKVGGLLEALQVGVKMSDVLWIVLPQR
jgi:hypothetical protein